MDLKQYMKTYNEPIFDVEVAQKAIGGFTNDVLTYYGNRVILYGAGIVGRRFLVLLRELGINDITLVDRNYDKIKDIDDVSVISPEDVDWENFSEDILVIASMNRNYLSSLRNFVKKMGYRYELYDGQTLYSVVRSAKCILDVECSNKLHDDITCNDCVLMTFKCGARRASLIRKFGKVNPSGSNKMWMIGYILGQFCTLKCKHCCESIPYFKNEQREFVEPETVIKDIKYMASACQFLSVVEFVGGEPFLHPGLYQILEEVIRIPNVGRVSIFTNGTVAPSDKLCTLLSGARLEVNISNYQISLKEVLKEKVGKTIKKLQQHGCNYIFLKRQSWLDFEGFDLVCNDENEIKDRFRNCFINSCNRLYKGVLYHCPHEYAGALQGHFDSNEDILHIYDYSVEELAKKLNEYKEKEYFESCKYCKLPYDAEPVASGIQMEDNN